MINGEWGGVPFVIVGGNLQRHVRTSLLALQLAFGHDKGRGLFDFLLGFFDLLVDVIGVGFGFSSNYFLKFFLAQKFVIFFTYFFFPMHWFQSIKTFFKTKLDTHGIIKILYSISIK